MKIGTLDQRIRLDYKVVTQDANYGTEVITWMDFTPRSPSCSLNGSNAPAVFNTVVTPPFSMSVAVLPVVPAVFV